jgi:hypothetical protein
VLTEPFFLPAYALEYNPDEYLNNDLKRKLKNLPRPDTHEELVQGTTSVLRSLQRSPHKIRHTSIARMFVTQREVWYNVGVLVIIQASWVVGIPR